MLGELRGLGSLADLAQAIVTSRPKVGDIGRAVCAYYLVPQSDICSPSRRKRATAARHVAMYLARQHTGLSLPELGRCFGRDHTTVLDAVQKVGRRKEREPKLADDLAAIERRLYLPEPEAVLP